MGFYTNHNNAVDSLINNKKTLRRIAFCLLFHPGKYSTETAAVSQKSVLRILRQKYLRQKDHFAKYCGALSTRCRDGNEMDGLLADNSHPVTYFKGSGQKANLKSSRVLEKL